MSSYERLDAYAGMRGALLRDLRSAIMDLRSYPLDTFLSDTIAAQAARLTTLPADDQLAAHRIDEICENIKTVFRCSGQTMKVEDRRRLSDAQHAMIRMLIHNMRKEL